MKKLGSALMLSGALLVSSLFSSHSAQAASFNYDVRIQINDELVSFPDAKPFIDTNQVTLVPIRFISEELGYKVGWEQKGSQIYVTIQGDGKSIAFTTGDSEVWVNGEQKRFQTNALFHEGRSYVPVRFISEVFGIRVQWDKDNNIAILDKDGKYHSPAWYRPKVMAPTLGDQIVTEAKRYVGTQYVWGGRTPNGFDCSGLVGYVYESKGVTLPRSSVGMVQQGYWVSDLQVGDLVFFSLKQNKVTSHVGIYVGNGSFISATNQGVKIDSLSDSYWKPKYLGAKRML